MKMHSIKNRRGLTLLELTVTISLMAIISFGITSAYIAGARRADEAMLMSESASMTGMITERITYDINRSKSVSWSGTDLSLTLYNDQVVTYKTQLSAEGKQYISRNGSQLVQSDYAESYINGSPVIDTTEHTVTMTVVVTLQVHDSDTRQSETGFTAYWRNQ